MRINKRIIVILIVAGCLLLFLGYLCRQSLWSENTYRNVKVLETEGEAYVTRKDTQISVYEQMIIQGGDSMVTGKDGRVDLQLDDDKYLVVEEDSQVEFELEGNKEKGAICIHLNQGAVYNEIDNPLAQDDSYEIHTPDGVMAVRGTKFRVSVRTSSNGKKRETRISVFDGTVHVQLDGNSDEVFLTEDNEAVINNNIDEKDENNEQSKPWFTKREGQIETDNLPNYLTTQSQTNNENETDAETKETPMATHEATPEATQMPKATPAATSKPTSRPVAVATATAVPTPEPVATATAIPTLTPVATEAPITTYEEEQLSESEPAEETPTLKPVETPAPIATPDPKETPASSESPVPTDPPTSSESPVPSATPTSSESPDPTETPTPSESPVPSATPTPSESPDSAETPTPSGSPVPSTTPST